MAHSTTVTPILKASSRTSLSLVSSLILASALKCASSLTPNPSNIGAICKREGWQESSRRSTGENEESVRRKRAFELWLIAVVRAVVVGAVVLEAEDENGPLLDEVKVVLWL